jgi:hypothetical protein
MAVSRCLGHYEILLVAKFLPVEIFGLHILALAVVLNLLAQFYSYRRWRGGTWYKTYRRRGGKTWSRKHFLPFDESTDEVENWPAVNVFAERWAAHVLGDALCLISILEMTALGLFHIKMSHKDYLDTSYYSSSTSALGLGAAFAGAGLILGIVLVQLSRSAQREIDFGGRPTPIQ